MRSPPLFHYTCQHGRDHLGDTGTLLPLAAQPGRASAEALARYAPEYRLLATLVWATDLEVPEPWALGLTSTILGCVRTAHRYQVPPERFTRWGRVRAAVGPVLADDLELAYRAEPARWWVAQGPVPGATYRPLVTPSVTPSVTP